MTRLRPCETATQSSLGVLALPPPATSRTDHRPARGRGTTAELTRSPLPSFECKPLLRDGRLRSSVKATSNDPILVVLRHRIPIEALHTERRERLEVRQGGCVKISATGGRRFCSCTVEWKVTLVPVSENLQYGSLEPPLLNKFLSLMASSRPLAQPDPQFVRRPVRVLGRGEGLPGVRRRVAPLHNDFDSAARVKSIPFHGGSPCAPVTFPV